MKKIFIVFLLTITYSFGNSNAQININNDTLEINGEMYLNDKFNVSDNSNYYFKFGYLGTEDGDGDDTQRLLRAGLKVLNPYTDDNGISLGLGIKSVYTNQMSKKFFAIPLSAHGKYELNEMIYFDLELSYAPKVLSFLDGTKYSDIELKGYYKVLEDGYVYLGSRYIKTSYDNGNNKAFDRSAFIGYELRF